MTLGRPSTYKPEYCQVAIEFMGRGFSKAALAGELNVGKETLFRWMDEHPDFRDAITVATSKRVAKLELDMLSTELGAVVNSRKFALLNADRDEWKDSRFTENTHTATITSIERKFVNPDNSNG